MLTQHEVLMIYHQEQTLRSMARCSVCDIKKKKELIHKADEQMEFCIRWAPEIYKYICDECEEEKCFK